MSDCFREYVKYKNDYLNLLMCPAVNTNTMEWSVQTGGQIKIPLQNKPNTPWLDWIASGKKKYEGRLNRGIFKKIKIGDIVVWYDKFSGKTIKTKITELKYYDDFGEAFEDLGEELIPIKDATVDTVKKLYSKYFSEDDIKAIKVNPVVAIGVEPIE